MLSRYVGTCRRIRAVAVTVADIGRSSRIRLREVSVLAGCVRADRAIDGRRQDVLRRDIGTATSVCTVVGDEAGVRAGRGIRARVASVLSRDIGTGSRIGAVMDDA